MQVKYTAILLYSGSQVNDIVIYLTPTHITKLLCFWFALSYIISDTYDCTHNGDEPSKDCFK